MELERSTNGSREKTKPVGRDSVKLWTFRIHHDSLIRDLRNGSEPGWFP